jgi:hypothetical protein
MVRWIIELGLRFILWRGEVDDRAVQAIRRAMQETM